MSTDRTSHPAGGQDPADVLARLLAAAEALAALGAMVAGLAAQVAEAQPAERHAGTPRRDRHGLRLVAES